MKNRVMKQVKGKEIVIIIRLCVEGKVGLNNVDVMSNHWFSKLQSTCLWHSAGCQ